MAKLYGIGVGSGDPELITVKALRILNKVKVIFVPAKTAKESTAYQIAEKIIDFSDKEIIACDMPMTKDRQVLERAHIAAKRAVEEFLKEGRDVAFLTLGDPCIYSTYMYLHKIIREAGYSAEIVNGIPSFCAAAARLGIALCEGAQELHILPGSYGMEGFEQLSGTKVLMKSGAALGKVKEKFQGREHEQVYMVKNCGMEGEELIDAVENIPSTAGYFTLVIVKDESNNL